MKLSLGTTDKLTEYVGRQLDAFFPDNYRFSGSDIESAMNTALERTEFCFNHIAIPHFNDGDGVLFSHMHADQYSQFLFFLSNSLWKQSENKPICDKLIYLNRVLHSFFYSYKCHLPDIFIFAHPVGSIIGNAEYSDFLYLSQGVTVNTMTNDQGNPLPRLGKYLFLGAGAKIIGDKTIGDRVSVGVDAVVYNREIPSDHNAIRREDGTIKIAPRKHKQCAAQNCFRVPD